MDWGWDWRIDYVVGVMFVVEDGSGLGVDWKR